MKTKKPFFARSLTEAIEKGLSDRLEAGPDADPRDCENDQVRNVERRVRNFIHSRLGVFLLDDHTGER